MPCPLLPPSSGNVFFISDQELLYPTSTITGRAVLDIAEQWNSFAEDLCKSRVFEARLKPLCSFHKSVRGSPQGSKINLSFHQGITVQVLRDRLAKGMEGSGGEGGVHHKPCPHPVCCFVYCLITAALSSFRTADMEPSWGIDTLNLLCRTMRVVHLG